MHAIPITSAAAIANRGTLVNLLEVMATDLDANGRHEVAAACSGGEHTVAKLQRHQQTVEQRQPDIRFDQPVIVHYRRDGGDIDQPVKPLPALTAEAADPACGRG